MSAILKLHVPVNVLLALCHKRKQREIIHGSCQADKPKCGWKVFNVR